MTPPPLTPSEKRTLLAIFAQHWENARHIKNERLSFTNIYAIVSAGILSLLHAVRGEAVLEISLLVFLFSFSVIGLLTSLLLPACLGDHPLWRSACTTSSESSPRPVWSSSCPGLTRAAR